LVGAAFGSWVLFWALYGGFQAYRQNFFSAEFINASRSKQPELAVAYSRLANDAGQEVGLSVMIGAGGLVVGLFLLLIGLWVWRGFVAKRVE